MQPQRADLTRHIRQILFVLGLSLSVCPSSFAVNTGFLPGDCVYHFQLTKQLAQEFEAKQIVPIRLPYSRPDWVPDSMCGFAGFWSIDGRELSPTLIEKLLKGYRHCRRNDPLKYQVTLDEETGNESRKEITPLSVLIYDAEYDFKTYGLFIKYNENWPVESIAWGWDAKSVRIGRYFPFINAPDTIMMEWLHASKVSPLGTKLPVKLEDTVGPACTQFVELTRPVMLIITSHKASEFENPAKGMKILIVKEEGLIPYEFAPRKGWITQEEIDEDDESR